MLSFTQWTLVGESRLPSALNTYGKIMAKSLDDHEARLLRHYSDDLHKPINAILRGQSGYSTNNKPQRVSDAGYHRMMQGAGKALQRTFAKYAIPQAATVYRYVELDVLFGSNVSANTLQSLSIRIAQQLKAAADDPRPSVQPLESYCHPLITYLTNQFAGRQQLLNGLISTTTDVRVAAGFHGHLRSAEGIIISATLPVGAPVIPMVSSLSENPDEAEVLLPHGTTAAFPSESEFATRLSLMVKGVPRPMSWPVRPADLASLQYSRFIPIIPVTYTFPSF